MSDNDTPRKRRRWPPRVGKRHHDERQRTETPQRQTDSDEHPHKVEAAASAAPVGDPEPPAGEPGPAESAPVRKPVVITKRRQRAQSLGGIRSTRVVPRH